MLDKSVSNHGPSIFNEDLDINNSNGPFKVSEDLGPMHSMWESCYQQ